LRKSGNILRAGYSRSLFHPPELQCIANQRSAVERPDGSHCQRVEW
jgi:hypothetical protein